MIRAAATFPIRDLEVGAGRLSLGAAIVHAVVTPEHFEEWWGYGLFFFIATLAQAGYALLLLLQPWRYDETGGFVATRGRSTALAIYWFGIGLNVAIIALYLVTRTVGIPLFGPGAGEVEEVTLLSLVSKGVEVALVAVLLLAVRTVSSRGPRTLA